MITPDFVKKVAILEEATRGFIESLMDKMLEDELTENVKWISRTIPIKSIRDLAIGYAIGLLDGTGTSVCGIDAVRKRVSKQAEEEACQIIIAMIKRRLPEIAGKIGRELNR